MIPFNKPYINGNELKYIVKAHQYGRLAGDGRFTDLCSEWLESTTGVSRALLTHSCTAALEMTALLLDIKPGDEIIMPSYTFVSTANAFALRGAVPVFVDIRADTLNIDESLIERAITERTRAIVVVHYAGVPCSMNAIMRIARMKQLAVIEDAAQAILSSYDGKQLGSIGDFGCFSFHETKNIHCGEGGALLIRDEAYAERAEIIREKGTNRSKFFRGEVDKYTWVDIGSSYLPGELSAAFLLAQLEESKELIKRRVSLWERYHAAFLELENREYIIRPNMTFNGHMYYLILRSKEEKDLFISKMAAAGIECMFHYQPLHQSRFGRVSARTSGQLGVTESLSKRLVRLPIWIGLEEYQEYIIHQTYCAVENIHL